MDVTGGGGAGGSPDPGALLCRLRHGRVVKARRLLRRMEAKLRRTSAVSRPRYEAYVTEAKRQLREAEKAARACKKK
jgi:hypothetical protein